MRRLISAILRYRGWTFEGTMPPDPKVVIPAAPHTSNWDFIVFLGAAYALGIRPRFIAKHGLFRWPLGWVMAAPGWHPGAARRQFPSGGAGGRPDPGGTGADDAAHNTQKGPGRPLPIGSRGSIGSPRQPTSRWCWASPTIRRVTPGSDPLFGRVANVSSDMDLIRAFYADKRGLHPEGAGPVRLREEGRPANRAWSRVANLVTSLYRHRFEAAS